MPYFSLEKIWKKKFSSGQTLARERDANSANSREVSRKKSGIESLDRSQQKDADSADSGDVTRP